MRAAFYDRQGPAGQVLQVGELPDPLPGPGEVRVRLHYSGVNPGDTKKRAGYFGSSMPYPRVIPHSDGSGLIDLVGEGVDAARVGSRVWVYHAQSYRAFGTAADYTCVPAHTAVPLPDEVDDLVGACLGIPGITAHRAVFADGPVAGRTTLVHGVLGAVGTIAAQLARWGGAQVIGTVRRGRDVAQVVQHPYPTVALDDPDVEQAIRALAPAGVDRIVEVAFSDNVELDARVAANGAVIAAYATRDPRPHLDFWPMLFGNLTFRLLGSDDFPDAAKRLAAEQLTAAAAEGDLNIPVGPALPLDEIAAAHDLVDADNRRRVVLDVTS